MRIHPSQVIPGCIIMKDIIGKTNRPLITKNTVVKDIHKQVLHRFLVQQVEVAPKLSSGDPFLPGAVEEPAMECPVEKKIAEPRTFLDQYLQAVKQYKKWFAQWQAGGVIHIGAIRQVVVPLLEQIKKYRKNIFMLHHFSTKDDYLYHHAVSTGLIAAFLGEEMGMNRGDWIQLGLAGLLSDAGMAKMNEQIILKETSLTGKEYQEVKKHPTYSYRMVENIPVLNKAAKLGILQHHERLDGSGYPLATNKKKIHMFARVIAVSDMYHAMTSERLYRSKQSPFLVLELMMKEQFGRFDYTVVQTFIKSMTNYTTGTKVKLSNDRSGEIVFVEPANPTRPMVRIADGADIINLKHFHNIYISEIYD
ncbi:HD-GYP domain-containing protein [Thalassobacillus devorans]|uniref:HD-GYP domain-containing protein n=1 Tax=Thalassobacillus devorans TaxID=279813 RepID=UPI00048AA0DC|nr:HD-GYP domain-containing protein [Thalassobacillus devorans]